MIGYTFKEAFNFYQKREFLECEKICIKILNETPNNFEVINLYAVLLFQKKNYKKAITFFNKAIKINPGRPDLYNNLSIALFQEKKYKEAIISWDNAIKIKPDYAEAFFNKGNVYSIIKDYKNSIKNFEEAIKIKKNYKEAFSNLGNVYVEMKDYERALEKFNLSTQISPINPIEYNNIGNIYFELKNFKKALENFDKALNIDRNFALSYYNKAKTFKEINNNEKAVINYEKAILLNKNFSEAYKNLGNVYLDLKILDKSIYNHQKALKINPNISFLEGTILQSKCGICDWENFSENKNLLEKNILSGKKSSNPFSTLLIYDSPHLHKKSSKIFFENEYNRNGIKEILKELPSNKKVHIGYYSSDFHNHATMYLMANLFEMHDKSKFQTYAFSFGQDDNSEIRNRVSKTFDKFLDVRLKTDEQIVDMSRELKIDIAVDLKGFTLNNRFGIFVKRCAPIQISYLGYPGTMASNCIDYLVADKTLIPEENKKFYTEKIIYMPNTYQVNDPTLKVSKKKFERKELGLPENGIVFCCFNQNYKILPDMFSIWIEIIKKVENSVLWLMSDNPISETNLKKKFIKNNISENRLIFASRMPHREHLSRLKLADIFLDTFPYNAHTTASDALRVGLPVVTLKGQSFASRVASSLLNSLDLNELITNSDNEYKKLAIKIAENLSLLQEIKKKINNNISNKPLFDAKLFTQHLEKAYLVALQRLKKNKSVDDIEIDH